MPRGIPNNKSGRRRRSAAAEEVAEDGAETPTLIPPSGVAVATSPTIGEAIELVRRALEPFDASKRKQIVRAANTVLR